jgi:exopolysaccharide biosynthesis polyprenyl glycosylphosphotransferase
MGRRVTFGWTISNSCILTIETRPVQVPWRAWWWAYLISDAVASASAWLVLFGFRKGVVEPRRFGKDIPWEGDSKLWLALVLIPLFWLAFHAAKGMYVDIRRRHRGLELRDVLITACSGGVLLFFALFLDDVTRSYTDHYQTFGVWMAAHVGLVLSGRWMLTSAVVRRVQNGEWAFQTLLIGDPNDNAHFLNELKRKGRDKGWHVVNALDRGEIAHDLEGLAKQLDEVRVDRAVLTSPLVGDDRLLGWIALLEGRGVELLLAPQTIDFFAGNVKTSNLFGVPLVNLTRHGMGTTTLAVKRALDVVLSAFALVVLAPLFVVLALKIRWDSQGPVFYRQERLGRHGIPFRIIKFRTMVANAEGVTPKLSSEEDPRITKVGRWLRQTRMDELPQFWNVLTGDMSLVGPRPERAYFANRIVAFSPHFLRLQRVRPGITSWGQVMFGYAENVDEMRQRLRYDIMYLDNMSLLLDVKILLYTVGTVLRREGK